MPPPNPPPRLSSLIIDYPFPFVKGVDKVDLMWYAEDVEGGD